MLKRITIKKITITTIALFAVLLIYIVPTENDLNMEEKLEYVDKTVNSHPIFLLDKNGYVSLTNIEVTSTHTEALAKELATDLIKGESENIPNGFKAIIPPNTRVLSVAFNEGLLKIDFSKEIYDVAKEYEEKMAEAITYTLTSIKGVNKIIMYVEGDILTKLPKTKINLPSTLDRTFGVNKEYEFTSLNNINDVTVYYVNENNGNYYYVPVTKYLNDDRDKANIVIDELSSSFNYNKNLKSFVNSEAKLQGFDLKNNILNLSFNSYIYDNSLDNSISDEVKEVILLSMSDNYDIKQVVFSVDNKEIYKSEIQE